MTQLLTTRRLARCLPWLLLAFSLSSLLVFSGERGSFYRPHMTHNWETAIDLSVAANLSLQQHLRLFVRLRPDQDGEPGYEVYSRFPVGAYALLKLAILPFDDDLAEQLLAARLLILILFFGAATLAFLALRRIAAEPWIALGATLLAFSSFHMLYFSDVVATEIIIDLFGMMLVLHGMVVYTQDGRLRQLLAKSCVALLLGWHVYALLLPFVVLGLVEEGASAWRGTNRRQRPGASHSLRNRLYSVTLALLRCRLLVLATTSLLFGIAVLGFNFANEHAMLKEEVQFADLPSVRSMLFRSGQDFDLLAGTQSPRRLMEPFPWSDFFFWQIHGAGAATIPYALPVSRNPNGRVVRHGLTGALVAGIGVLALGVCLLGGRGGGDLARHPAIADCPYMPWRCLASLGQ